MSIPGDVLDLFHASEPLKNLEKFVSIVLDVAGKLQTAQAAQALKSADSRAQEYAETWLDAGTVDKLAREMARNADKVKPGSDIFPPEYRREFIAAFYRQYPNLHQSRDTMDRVIQHYFYELENALRDNYSKEGRLILRHEILNQIRLEEIERAVKENRDISAKTYKNVREIRDDVQAMQGDVRKIWNALEPSHSPEQAAAPEPHTSNKAFARSFEEPLFLHNKKNTPKYNPNVNLSNLFVPHRFTEWGMDKPSEEQMDDYLARFIGQTQTRFLFIEADAGCGKSSLTAYLCWHYENQRKYENQKTTEPDETARKVFGDVTLFSVRLREIGEYISTNGRKADRLLNAILRFLYPDAATDNERNLLIRESEHPLLLCDGYDELCSIEGIEEPLGVLSALQSLDCNIIVTTRPEYIPIEKFRPKSWSIKLEHFDKNQRQEWLNHYIACGEKTGEINQKYLNRIDQESDTAGICDTPLGLYMVAAGHFDETVLGNDWALYRQIFYCELSDTVYNKQFSKYGSWAHDISEHSDKIYMICEEIAWHFYKNGNKNLVIHGDAVKDIIRRMELSDKRTENILNQCYALCGYWRNNQGGVEFYHNNIRDFFLCEKIMRELNQFYQENLTRFEDKSDNLQLLQRRLCKLFQYSKIEARVLEFIRMRSMDQGGKDTCIRIEQTCRCTARFFEPMLLFGTAYSALYERWSSTESSEHPIQTIARILGNTVAVYRSLYEPFLMEKEYIHWGADVDAVKQSGTLQRLAGDILYYAGQSDLRGAALFLSDLSGADLRWADLSGADLHWANLSHADLSEAYLSGADLRWANLFRADLREVDLHEARLIEAELSEAYLTEADLSGAYLNRADLRGADLRGANLQGANLDKADLRGAKYKNSDLEGTIGTPITDDAEAQDATSPTSTELAINEQIRKTAQIR